MNETTASVEDIEPDSPGTATRPARSCDLIMKGGIASGVFYPRAVREIAESYRLRNIGGASAGAIAAAAAAAAEFARRSGTDGYARLESVIDELRQIEDGKTLLERLFSPDRRTRRLWRLGEKLRRPSGPAGAAVGAASVARRIFAAPSTFPLAGAMGAVIGLLVAAPQVYSALRVIVKTPLQLSPLQVLSLGGALLIAAIGASLGGWIAAARSVVREVPNNLLGIISGHQADATSPALTDWLDEALARIAGLKPNRPLTFGHLWVHDPTEIDRSQPTGMPEDPDINLELMTTSLNLAVPFRMPRTSMRQFFFLKSEFERLFPPHVVRHMVCAGVAEAERRGHTSTPTLHDEEFIAWPHPADVPVIVATRMSLAMPGVLSAVPLWAGDFVRPENRAVDGPDRSDKAKLVLERCWFSDGGLSSNFPVHLFDAAIPTRPTFALDLRRYNPAEPDAHFDVTDRLGDNAQPWWRRIDTPSAEEPGISTSTLAGKPSLLGFIGLLVDAMKHWQDDALARVPGYRERIVHIHHTESEGGMNLDMDQEVIDRLANRGRDAAREILRVFSRNEDEADAGQVTWDRHRWTRYRTMIAALEGLLGQVDKAWNSPDVLPPYDYLAQNPPNSHRWASEKQARFVGERASEFRDLAGEWTSGVAGDPGVSATQRAPQPISELRLRPRL